MACLAVAIACGFALPHTIDDAFILLRYAQNIAGGQGYVFNTGAATDGVTGPLWLLIPIAAQRLGLDPLWTVKAFGALCACSCALWVGLWAQRRAQGLTIAWTAACVLACLPDVGSWAVAGLETPLAMLAMTVLTWGALDRRARPIVAGAATAVLAWLRPELAPCACVLWLALCLRKPAPRGLWLGLAMALLGAASVLGFRLALFGELLPLSASAKPAHLVQGLRYVGTSVVLWTSLVGLALAFFGARLGQARDRWLGAALLVHGAAVALAGGDWMPGARLLVPVAPLYALLVGVGVARLMQQRTRGPARPRARWVLVGLALSCSLPLLDLVARMPELRASGARREQVGHPLAEYLREHARAVALLDVGYLGYVSGLEVIDLGGLTDPQIAHLPGGHIDKRIEQAFLRTRNPDAIVLHSTHAPRVDRAGKLLALTGYPVEMRVAIMPWVREHFRVAHVVHYAPSYWYAVLLADRDVRSVL